LVPNSPATAIRRHEVDVGRRGLAIVEDAVALAVGDAPAVPPYPADAAPPLAPPVPPTPRAGEDQTLACPAASVEDSARRSIARMMDTLFLQGSQGLPQVAQVTQGRFELRLF
jgi:hypothetical protein